MAKQSNKGMKTLRLTPKAVQRYRIGWDESGLQHRLTEMERPDKGGIPESEKV